MTTADHLAWRTSRYSSNGENCVEVAPTRDRVIIRHSKNPAAGTIEFTMTAWAVFLADASRDLPCANGAATIVRSGQDTAVRSAHTGVELVFDPDEWRAFVTGVRAAEFDF